MATSKKEVKKVVETPAEKAVEKRKESAEDVSKLVRDQVADAVALARISQSDKFAVASNLSEAFNLKSDSREDFLDRCAYLRA